MGRGHLHARGRGIHHTSGSLCGVIGFLNLLVLITDTCQEGQKLSSKSLNSGFVYLDVVIPVCFENYQSCSLLVSPQQLSSSTTPQGNEFHSLPLTEQSFTSVHSLSSVKRRLLGFRWKSLFTLYFSCVWGVVLMTHNFLLVWVFRLFYKSLWSRESILNSSITCSFLNAYFKHQM